MAPGKPIGFNRFQPKVFGFIQGNAQDGETFIFIIVVSFYYVRVFCAAGATPACPEINQYIFTFERGQGNVFTVCIFLRERNSLFTDAGFFGGSQRFSQSVTGSGSF
jgi:hypothetical protein